MSDEDLKAELERLRNENAALKRESASGTRLKVSEKGAVSVYRVSNLYHLLDFSRVRNEALVLPVFESRAPVPNRRFFWENEDVMPNLEGSPKE